MLCFIFFLILFLNLKHCISFAKHQNESTTGIHVLTIPLGRPNAPAPSIQYHALNLDWQLVSYMILHMFQCHSPKSSHPLIDSLYLVIIFSVLSSISDLSIYIFFSWLLKLFLLHYEIGQLVKICEKKKTCPNCYHLSKFHIYVLVYCIGVFLSGLLHSV